MSDKGHIKKWVFPKFSSNKDGTVQVKKEQDELKEIEKSQLVKQAIEQGYQEGLKKGKEEGRKKAYKEYEEEWIQRIRLFDTLLEYFNAPMTLVDKNLEESLMQMIKAIARRIIKHELSINPELIFAMIHEAKQLIPVTSSAITIFVNEEDLNLIQSSKELDINKYEFIISDDLARGEFKIQTTHSEIISSPDECVDTIINRVLNDA